MSEQSLAQAFPESATTWTDHQGEPTRLPPELRPEYREQSFWQRVNGYGRREQLRSQWAQQIYADRKDPDKGLPVADNKEVFAFLRELIAKRRGLAVALLIFNILAALAGLLVPRRLGDIVDGVTEIGASFADQLPSLVAIVAALVVAQALLNFAARRVSTIFGQGILAEAREQIMRTVLRLPLSRVESAATGDLVTRVTRDVGQMAMAVRWALPHFILNSVVIVMTIVAMVTNSAILALPFLIYLAVVVWAARRYLRRANRGYIAAGAAYSKLNSTLTETIEGIRSVEALGLKGQRIRAVEQDLELAGQGERHLIGMRVRLFFVTYFADRLPLVCVLLLGGWGYAQGWLSLGEITAATIYLQQLSRPLNMSIATLNMLQQGVTSTARLLGIATVPADREISGEHPADEHIIGRELRFAYRPGHDVLHGVDIDLQPGERLAIVGPSGSGKSTLGRLLAGINAPRTGVVEVGGVDIMGLPLDELRTTVALVTQEHHVFVGSIRDNIVLARENEATDDEVWEALKVVEADDWVRRLPDGLDTKIGSGRMPLTPGQAQQIALARLVIADPHTLILDEATSLIDPTTAREVEGSMSSLLLDRTVVAIAHRLHTAHDADRIAVVIDGEIAELGSHDELMALDGEYAKLWHAWTN